MAGSAFASLASSTGVSVALFEKRQLPEDKLCGEFLSTEVAGLLEHVGVRNEVLAAGAVPVRSVRLTAGSTTDVRTELPGIAFGLSRHTFDLLLIEHARACGAKCFTSEPVTGLEGDLDNGFVVRTVNRSLRVGAVVGAYGRNASPDRWLRPESMVTDSPFVAFKAHFRGPSLDECIELHSFRGGYCGMIDVDRDRICVCWITHRSALAKAGGKPQAMIDNTFASNAVLKRRFASMQRVSDRYWAGAQLAFRPKSAFAADVCLVGDAAGMIAPLSGDGMAMALQSAAVAAPLVVGFVRRDLKPAQFKAMYQSSWDAIFRRRMWLGRHLHGMLSRPIAARAGLALGAAFPPLLRSVIAGTRGAAPPV